jgi:hypothetical protein
MKKSKITHEAQFVDWEYIRRKKNVIFNEVLAECEENRIRHIMGFRHGWNKEIVAQFYATMFFGHHESDRAMFWMTAEQKYHITFSNFVSLLRLGSADIDLPKLHDAGVLETREMHFMYPRNMRGSWRKVNGIYSYYGLLNRLFRKILTPRDGNTSDVTLFQRNLMATMRPGAPQFSVGDFIWQKIKNVSENPQKICSYSPYIMFMIWKVTGIKFPNDVKHMPLRPPKTGHLDYHL